jgi:hypothetical protein
LAAVTGSGFADNAIQVRPDARLAAVVEDVAGDATQLPRISLASLRVGRRESGFDRRLGRRAGAAEAAGGDAGGGAATGGGRATGFGDSDRR